MSFLNADEYNAQDAVEKDVVGGGGFKALASNIYDLTVNHAYFSKAASGARAVNLELETKDGSKHRFTIYVTNREGSIKYKDKQTGELKYLPGFQTVDALCKLTSGKSLIELQAATEKRTLNLYNYEQKREVPTDVDMLMPLLKKTVKAAIVERIENKTKKNESTGKYDPINEKRTTNEIVKFMRERDSMTVGEIIGKKAEAEYAKNWLSVWENKPDDRYKEVAQAGNAGVPGGAFAGGAEPAGTTAGQDNLFM